MPLASTEHLHIYIPFLWRVYTCKVNLPRAIYPCRGRKREEMCVAPQLPHVDKWEAGGKKSKTELYILAAVFTRLFSSFYVFSTVFFTMHQKAKQPICFLYLHVSDIVRRLTFVFLFILQHGSDSLLFANMFVCMHPFV